MAKTETKFDFIKQVNEKWKKDQQCFDVAKVEGKDRLGKKTTISQQTIDSLKEKINDQGRRLDALMSSAT